MCPGINHAQTLVHVSVPLLIFFWFNKSGIKTIWILNKHLKCFWDSWFMNNSLQNIALKPFNLYQDIVASCSSPIGKMYILSPFICSVWIRFSLKGGYWAMYHFNISSASASVPMPQRWSCPCANSTSSPKRGCTYLQQEGLKVNGLSGDREDI